VFAVAGLEESKGIFSSIYIKDPTNPAVREDPDYKEWLAFMKNYYPDGDLADYGNGFAYAISWTLAAMLKECGDDLTRANVMKKVSSMKDIEVPMLVAGIRLNTSEIDYAPISQTQLVQFDGKRWMPMGEVLDVNE
jgi:branched-chain amino acid transport system substrate-binding protein